MTCRTQKLYPAKALSDLKKVTAYKAGSIDAMALIEREHNHKIYKVGCAEVYHRFSLEKQLKYRTSKTNRS
jgi:hypothetical protein